MNESKFNLFGSDGLQYCWRRKGQALDPCYTNKQVKHRWEGHGVGCITVYGVGRLCQVDGHINSTKYISILQEGYFGTLEDLHTNRTPFSNLTMIQSIHTKPPKSGLKEITSPPLIGQPLALI